MEGWQELSRKLRVLSSGGEMGIHHNYGPGLFPWPMAPFMASKDTSSLLARTSLWGSLHGLGLPWWSGIFLPSAGGELMPVLSGLGLPL